MTNVKERVLKLMEGAYDVHMHALPSITECGNTVLEVFEEAKTYKMKGMVYKDIHFNTAPIATLLSTLVPEVDAISGVTLGRSVGGINPWAVESTFKIGGKVVWMPALDSKYTLDQIFAPGYAMFSMDHYKNLGILPGMEGYSVFRKDTEELTDDAKEIIALCKQYDCVLETCHVSLKEGAALVRESKNQGFNKMVITHANSSVTQYPLELQRELVEMGATIMYTFDSYMSKPGEGGEPMANLAKIVKQIGTENVVLGTDFGLSFWPSSVEGIRMMITSLLTNGISEDEIARMVKENPSRIYGK